MKKILYYTMGVASLALLLIVTSCVNDPTTDSSSGVNDPNAFLTVEEAQEFFESSFMSVTRSTIAEASCAHCTLSPGEYTAQWDEAVSSENELIGSVDVPIIATNRFRAIRSEFKYGRARAYMVNMEQRLVVVKGRRNENISQYILTLIPDKSYYAKNKNGISRKFLHAGDKSDFSGVALYHCPQRSILISVARYSNGRRVRSQYLHNPGADMAKMTKIANEIVEPVQIQVLSLSISTDVECLNDSCDCSECEKCSNMDGGICNCTSCLLCKECPCVCHKYCPDCENFGCRCESMVCEYCGEKSCYGECQDRCQYNRCPPYPFECLCCPNCFGECKMECLQCGKCTEKEPCGCSQ